MPDAPRIPCGEHVAYYSSWQTDTWQCSCGWTGTGKDAAWEPFDALVQVDCPQCDGRLCLVSHPTDDEHREAAALGNAEAIRAIEQMAGVEPWRKRLKRSKLYSPKRLPALDDVDQIDLSLGLDEDARGDAVYVLSANGEMIHSEVAEWETISPLPRILRHATARYGERIASFKVEFGAFMYLAGDSLALGKEIETILTATGFDPEDGHRVTPEHPISVPAILEVCIDDSTTIYDEGVDASLVEREVARLRDDAKGTGSCYAIASLAGDDDTFAQIALTEGRVFQVEIHDDTTDDGCCLTRHGVETDEAARIISGWLAGEGAIGEGWTTVRWSDGA